MALILNIDTSGQRGTVALAENGSILAAVTDGGQMQHASFLQPAIKKLMAGAGLSLDSIDAVAVGNGPGSYTGLRVGLASAKGICHALDKPLITLGSLKLLAYAARQKVFAQEQPQSPKPARQESDWLFCPMTDARRMEVFYALYDAALNELVAPQATILDTDFLQASTVGSPVAYIGSGVAKWEKLATGLSGVFLNEPDTTPALAQLSFTAFSANQFADLFLAEPFYCKAFHDTKKK